MTDDYIKNAAYMLCSMKEEDPEEVVMNYTTEEGESIPIYRWAVYYTRLEEFAENLQALAALEGTYH